MESLLGTNIFVFVWITGIVIGFAAWMTGQAIAGTWRPYKQVVAYCLLLACVARFLIYGLYDGVLFHLTGYIAASVTLIAIGSFAYSLTRARKMVNQYPWIYERTGLFGWRARS
jgi:hypothetical protein